VAIASDDQMIVHDNAEGLGDVYDVMRHANVGGGGRRIAGRVVMRQDQGAGAELQSAPHHLARIDRVWSTRADSLHFVGDQPLRLSRNST